MFLKSSSSGIDMVRPVMGVSAEMIPPQQQ
jgi:hypothetical protein